VSGPDRPSASSVPVSERMKSVDGFTLIGVPIDSVGRSGGTELAPKALRSLDVRLPYLWSKDVGDLDVRIRGEERDRDTGIVGSPDVLRTTQIVRRATSVTLEDGERPFLAGGCCTLLPGALAGARDALGGVGLAYVDGHLDLYDGVTSTTGEAADMPMSVVLGRGPTAWVEAIGGPAAPPEAVAVLGYRDLEETKTYGSLQPEDVPGLTHVTNEGLRVEGPAAAGERIARTLEERTGSFWVHLDVDVLDEEVFPATDYLMPAGLTWDELVPLLAPLVGSKSLIGASIGCYNPEKDDPELSAGRDLVAGWRAALGLV
jgi:arginase